MMSLKTIASIAAVLALAMLPAGAAVAAQYGDTLVGNVFVTGFDGWTDMFPEHGTVGGGLPDWGVLLTGEKALCESSDGRAGTSATRDGMYKPYVMVNTAYETSQTYTLSAEMASWDDDGFGLVFGYKDYDNYFRIGFREQSTGSLGFAEGASIQKIVGGVITQIGWNSAARPPFDGVTPWNPTLTVDGTTGAYSLSVNGDFVFSGSDSDLLGNAAGQYGALSWYQQFDTSAASRYRGTLVHSMSIDEGSNGTVDKQTVFSDAIVADWRPLRMTNSEGVQGTPFLDGNFRQHFTSGRILDGSNAYTWATAVTPNVDFLGSAVVIDEEGSAGWTDYEMAVRVECGDNEGPGVLVRVQDDDTFYRINFAAEPMISGNYTYQRVPQGLSVQKCLDGVWTELFRDDQSDPSFVYTHYVGGEEGHPALPFDLKVQVIGDMIKVQVIDDPDGAATVIDYDPIYDTSDPILSGSVGLTNWGGGTGGLYGLYFAPYGGVEGTPLLTAIPEPSTFVLLALMTLCGLGARRRG